MGVWLKVVWAGVAAMPAALLRKRLQHNSHACFRRIAMAEHRAKKKSRSKWMIGVL